MRDMDISFSNRFKLLKMIRNKEKHKYFEKDYLEMLIDENKINLI